MTLSDTHLVLLSAAAQRDHGLLVPPPNSTEAGRERLRSQLLKQGLVAEQTCAFQQPDWHEADGVRLALKITAAGLAAIGLEGDVPSIVVEGAVEVDTKVRAAKAGATTGGATPPARQGGKVLLLVTELLQRPDGATITELTAATGWQAHSVRAVISGLRKKGHDVTLDKSGIERHAYRIGPVEQTEVSRDGNEAVG